VKRRRVAGKTSPWFLALLEDLGCEASGDPQVVYLGTVSRVLPGAAAGYRDLEAVTKAELSSMVRDAVDSPVGGGSTGGRPRTRTDSPVDFTIVVKEKHADGTSHVHVGLKLNRNMRFGQATKTCMEQHEVPSHWSCTHRHVWSAVRYLHVPSPKKPVVDDKPEIWTFDGRTLDLMELSREPWVAHAWRRRREAMGATAAV
jgi:hypothetical protein